MDEAANAGAAAPAQPPKSMFSKAVEHFLDLFALRTPLVTPQEAAAEDAYLLKASNAHRFAPRHPPFPLSHAEDIVLPGTSVHFTFNKRFPGNLCLVRRGMDPKTFKAALRTTKRHKINGYQRVDVNRFEAAAAAWHADVAFRGFEILPVKASWAR